MKKLTTFLVAACLIFAFALPAEATTPYKWDAVRKALGTANTDFLPESDGTYDIGSSTLEWEDGHFDGTLNADTVDIDVATDIDGTLDVSGAEILGASPLVFEGATANGFETSFATTDPTTPDKVITFQDATGIVVTDVTACTDLEGTLLAITAGTLNATEAQTLAAVTALGASTTTLSTFTGGLTLGADDDPSNLILHSASTLTMYEDSDDFSASLQCKDAAAEWLFNDDVNIGGASDAENLYVHNAGIQYWYEEGDSFEVHIACNDGEAVATLTGGLDISGVLTTTNAALTTPTLGTPASGTLTNCTGLPAAAVLAGTLGTGAYVFDNTISGMTGVTMGSATVDTGTFTMIKGAQTSNPQVQFALSSDGVGDFSITTANGTDGDIHLLPSGGTVEFGATASAVSIVTHNGASITMYDSNDDTQATISISNGATRPTITGAIFSDDVTINTGKDLSLGGLLRGVPDAITATGEGVAASVETTTTEVTTNDDNDLDNVTLANGKSGQIKFIYCVASFAGDTWKITPATMLGGTQITFGDTSVGDGCTLIYADSEGWSIVSNQGGTIS